MNLVSLNNRSINQKQCLGIALKRLVGITKDPRRSQALKSKITMENFYINNVIVFVLLYL